MHGLLTRDAFRATVAECWEVEASQQMLAGPEQYWRHRELHLIDQPGLQVRANGLRAAKETNVLAACRGSRTFQRRVDSVGDEVEDGATFHFQWRPGVVRQHERGRVIGWILTPPPAPG